MRVAFPMASNRILPAWLDKAIVAIVFVGLVLFGWSFARYGVVPSDEGMALAAMTQYALGDAPLRHDGQAVGKSQEILFWPILKAFPDLSLLSVRYIGQALHLAVLIVFFLVFRRFCPDSLAALAVATWAFMATGPYRTPLHDWCGVDLYLLGIALWLLASFRRSGAGAVALGLLSAVALVMGSIAYWTFPPSLIAIPVAVLLVGRLGGDSLAERCPHYRAAGWTAFLASCGALAAIGVFLLVSPWHDYIARAVHMVGQYEDYSESHRPLAFWRVRKYLYFLKVFAPQWFSFLAVGGLGFLAVRWLRRRPVFSVLAFGLAAFAMWALLDREFDFDMYGRVYLFNATLGFVGLTALVLVLRRLPNVRLLFVLAVTTVWCVGLSWIQVLISGGLVWQAGLAIGPVLSVCVVVLWSLLTEDDEAEESPRLFRIGAWAFLGVFCLALTVSNLYRVFHIQYREKPTEEMTAVFSIQPLRGIRSTPLTVQNMEGLADAVGVQAERGDFVLDYSGTPIVYFLTKTRPSLYLAWSMPQHGKTMAEAQMRRLDETGRTPVVCLMSTWQNQKFGEDAITRYIRANYELARRIGEFEVWVRPGQRL